MFLTQKNLFLFSAIEKIFNGFSLFSKTVKNDFSKKRSLETACPFYTNNKGSAFFALIVAMLFFGTMGLATVSIMATNLAGSTEGYQGTQAFYVAEGGIQHTVMNELFDDTDFTDNVSPTGAPLSANSISLGQGEFWVEYLNQSDDLIDVRVTGRVGNTIRVITQTITGGYDYIAMAEGNLNAQNSTGSFNGDLGLEGNLNLDTDIALNGGVIQTTNIDIPTMNTAVYDAMTTDTHNGTKVFNADYTGNLHVTGNAIIQSNVTINGILYVEGNVNIIGDNVTINGTLVAEGNINSTHDNLTFISQPIDDDEHMPAIVGQGGINFANTTDMEIYGLVWNTGNIDFSSSVDLDFEGSIVSGGNLLLNYSTNMDLTFNTQLLMGIPGLQDLGQIVTSVNMSNWRLN